MDQLPQELLTKLQMLADKLGVSIQFVYEQLVKDNTRLGLIGMITSLFLILVFVGVWFVGYKVVPKIISYGTSKEKNLSQDTRAAIVGITIAGAIIGTIVLFCFAGYHASECIDSAKRFAAPNKYTVEDIKDLIHGESLVYNKHGNTK